MTKEEQISQKMVYIFMAAIAMHALLTKTGASPDVVRQACETADQMLAELKKPKAKAAPRAAKKQRFDRNGEEK